MEYYDIVKKLIGPIDAVGETNADIKRLDNLEKTIFLIDKLIIDIVETSKNCTRCEYSMKKIGLCAKDFMILTKEFLEESLNENIKINR